MATTHTHPSCYIRISMNNLKDIHNGQLVVTFTDEVVILGFQWTIWRTYTTERAVGAGLHRCYIRISMNNLKDIHNSVTGVKPTFGVVILGFQWTIWRTYTTVLYYCNAAGGCYIRISMNNLKDIHNKKVIGDTVQTVVILGFQWTIWRTYTTPRTWSSHRCSLLY